MNYNYSHIYLFVYLFIYFNNIDDDCNFDDNGIHNSDNRG